MGSQDTPPEVKPTPSPAEEVDAAVGGEMEKSLLKRRAGYKEAYLTKGQKKPSLLQLGKSKGKL